MSIRVTIELLPGGREHGKKLLGTVHIANITGAGDASRANYLVSTSAANGRAVRAGRVYDHARKRLPVYTLIRKAIEAMGY